jgi:hypothetical protein
MEPVSAVGQNFDTFIGNAKLTSAFPNDRFFWRVGPGLQSWGERLSFSPCCARILRRKVL